MVSFATADNVVGVMPLRAESFFANWAAEAGQVNPLIIKAAVIDHVEGFEVIRYDTKLPFPLDNRVFFSIKYVKELPDNEHMFLMSATGNEDFIAKHFSDPKDRKGLTIGTSFITCWWFKPLKDEPGKTIGSSITYIFSANPGGSIPKSMTESQGPKTAINALKGIIKHLSK